MYILTCIYISRHISLYALKYISHCCRSEMKSETLLHISTVSFVGVLITLKQKTLIYLAVFFLDLKLL